jgi:hypothetical protein
MKQGLEGRLRKLEREYAVAPDMPHVVSVGWLTADQIKRGLRAGLYRRPPEDGDSLVVPASVDSEDVAKSRKSDVLST